MIVPSYIILLSWSQVTQWLERNMLSCPFARHLHIECPGCGFQRSVIALLKGDLAGSIRLYPALIPFLVLAVYTALHLRSHFSKGPRNIRIMQVFVVGIVVVHYIYKINNRQIFV